MTVFIREAHHSTKWMRSFPTGQIITKWERPVHLLLTKPTRRKRLSGLQFLLSGRRASEPLSSLEESGIAPRD
jgi:hypothetical protein